MAYANIHPGIWDNLRFKKLSRDAKLTYLYLVTGPEACNSVPGLVQIGTNSLGEIMGLDDRIEPVVRELSRGKKKFISVDRKRRLIRVHKAPKHRRPGNPNVLRGWYRKWIDLPKSPLKYDHLADLHNAIQDLSPKIWSEWCTTFGNHFEIVPESLSPPDAFESASDNNHNDSGAENDSTNHLRSTVDHRSVIVDRGSGSDAGSETISLWQLEESLRVDLGARPRREPDEKSLEVISGALRLYTQEELEHALRITAANAQTDPEARRWFNGLSNWNPKVLRRAVNQLPPKSGGRLGPQSLDERWAAAEERKRAEEAAAGVNGGAGRTQDHPEDASKVCQPDFSSDGSPVPIHEN
jgi:hypothetical protein